MRYQGIHACALGACSFGLALAAATSLTARAAGQAAVPPVSFNRDIRPILSNNCFACHGPDATKRETEFHFDTREGAFAEDGIIVPGSAAGSMLVKRITNPDPKKHMPPPDSGHALTARQIELLRRWIDEGAKWDTHWAYTAPVRPDLPAVDKADWVRNPIDRFILARLEREGLKPSPEADKATLLRRVTYDLTGLPPTPAELDAFLADRSPDAYERRVDALLQSPHYGERMAVPWLDASRYADTHGYHIDSQRGMWPWRDWVIGAFNRNLPYDQFTIEQLAGDLLPDATRDQKIASGFNRNHMINFEGGAIADEYQVEYVIDRVEATSTAFMGLTMGCARCHSHKFDPISHKEFYQFFAFFNNVPELGLDGRRGNAVPMILLTSPAQQKMLDDLDKAIKAHEDALDDDVVTPVQREWEASAAGKLEQAAPDLQDIDRKGLSAHYELDGSFSDISGRFQHGRMLVGDPTFDVGQIGRAVTFDGDTEVSFGNVGRFDRSDAFSLAVWIRARGNLPIAVFQKLDDAGRRRGFEWRLDDMELYDIQRWAARLTITLTSEAPANAIQVRTRERLKQGEWNHVVMSYDGSGKAEGLAIYANGKRLAVDVLRNALAGPIATDAAFTLGRKELGPPYAGQIDDLRLYNRVLTPGEVETLAIHYRPRAILSGNNGKRSKDQGEYLREYFLKYAAPEPLRGLYSELETLQKQKEAVEKPIPTAMVMAELKKPRETFVLARGDYRNHTEKVQPGVPAMLPPLEPGSGAGLGIGSGAPANRLTLAKWLVQPGHPLTSRVAVNRFWLMYFGQGIVKTQEDFGVQGEPPVHPQLLDWLATEFVRTGWDVKAMQRLIVTSATYRQSSRVTPALLEKDPENRLLARGPRFRLPAEMIRDTALTVSGLLNDEIGGPSVLPYQPKGLWEELAFGDGYSAQTYEQSHGKDLYRRGMYTFWKRTAPPASLATFDAPDREKCTGRRALTNTPLQALVLLNDPTYVEAARALAQRTLLEGGTDEKSRVAFAFRLATARKPSGRETGVLRKLLETELKSFEQNPAAATKLLAVGESARDKRLNPAELAAWTTVASVILNLDETVTRQ
jgi:mono/diheme cytochrome c family protein